MSKTRQPQQQPPPPFPNKYNARLVAQHDAKPCTICFKPATTVLLAENQADFFYTCVQHLTDEQFASPIKSEEYVGLQQQVDDLSRQVDKLKIDADAAKPYLWGISTYWSKDTTTSTSKEKEREKNKDKDKHDTKEKDSNSDSQRSNQQTTNNYESLRKQLQSTQQELQTNQTKLTNFKFKQYILNHQVYANRLKRHQQKKYNKQRTELIHQPGFFPQLPKS
ncbi:AAA-ATPase Vps4-associated protein 1 family protein [Candida parapsilosis]|uniref:VPS4-associated protein 1 n=2 Tax=Candida parapsilosis TaxID=5480 RepID=G8BKA3_CANPC|nr:uncharacterized protein CPAR2_701800 [Candida parapsilosis]KAF6042258.1 AAA-ATPase Vps4-associated protein 1 family protein [Candida parapsilosis]KAF6042537.1 AAA-ATPase Vps4-associated protein 1 family protein [Candida parapsilosis]KAF6042982.1 AAA-ATPase Vps4-associated protein 1 family protein [Candida parapsilosis]KAF6058009.1 AAA-ATPase Vps4-associated protein 1 family protein [Candida parapsilosis]KAI5901123.1 hypothetical protein K4G60_g249 [Candida parapsilosis]